MDIYERLSYLDKRLMDIPSRTDGDNSYVIDDMAYMIQELIEILRDIEENK